MRKLLFALALLLVCAVLAAVVLWPEPQQPPAPAAAAGTEAGADCDSCTLRHQRLLKQGD